MTETILAKLQGDHTLELDLSNHQLISLMQQIKYIPLLQHLTSCKNLQMLDLSSNRFKYLVPPTTSNAALTALKLPSLLSLNISDNPIVNVRQVVNTLA